MTAPRTVQPNGALDSRRYYSPNMLTEEPCTVCGYRVPLALNSAVHPCCADRLDRKQARGGGAP